MKTRIAIIASLALAFLVPRGHALRKSNVRQQEQGVTSGPAAGTPVEPSGAVQKDNPKAADVNPSGLAGRVEPPPARRAEKGQNGNAISGQTWQSPERSGRGATGRQSRRAYREQRFKLAIP